MTPATSGLPSLTPFAFYDPDSSCWRTSQGTFLSGSDEFSGTWPKQGTTRSGAAYERPMPGRATGGNGSSLLPTPNTLDGMNPRSDEALASAKKSGGCFNLKDVVPRLLPTPTSRDHKGRNQRDDDTCLPGAVDRLLPTPVRADGERASKTYDRGNPTLLGALLPTPRAEKIGGRSSPDYRPTLEQAIGDPTPQPSTDGNEPSDGPPPPRLWEDG